METTIDLQELPAIAENKLYLDYLAGADAAGDFFSLGPLDFADALGARRERTYPRSAVIPRLRDYNASLGAHSSAMANIDVLENPATFCVISGQQAGFLGGPMYTVYKIIATIRLTAYLQANLGGTFVPVFWLATEDHDFNEINHANFLKRDGEVGEVEFEWEQEGRPISDLPITEGVKGAFNEYFESIPASPHRSSIKELLAPQSEESFSAWHARIWSELFSERGLVIVEPRLLRAPASDFFQFALRRSDEIQHRLDEVSRQLRAAGYTPALTAGRAGQLYTFDSKGRRTRVEAPQEHLTEAAAHPERYSTDAALRPLFADTMLPVAASVLGPGETAYHAMLKSLYELFDLPQPVLFPRKSCTIVGESEAERIAEYGTSVVDILTERADLESTFRDLAPSSDLEAFEAARREVEAALSPLRLHVESIDPSLKRTWEQTLTNAMHSLDKLRERAVKSTMSQLGYSKGELRGLRNALLPLGKLQERVLPLPHFLNRHGTGFIGEIFFAGGLKGFAHHVIILEDEHARN